MSKLKFGDNGKVKNSVKTQRCNLIQTEFVMKVKQLTNFGVSGKDDPENLLSVNSVYYWHTT